MANQGVLEKMKKGIQESDRCFHDENDDDEDKWLKVIKLLGFTNKYTKYDDFVYTHTHICDRFSEGTHPTYNVCSVNTP